jgi:hypothetical protein
MYNKFREYSEPRGSQLRMSMIGSPDRKAWYKVRPETPKEEFTPTQLRKFLMGDIIEEIVLFLAKEAGHEVTEEQGEAVIEGVLGHKDCRIDGVTVDVKSASTRGFDKFLYHKLESDDPFNYMHQIAGYVQAESEEGKNNDEVAFLAFEKQHTKMCLDKYSTEDLPSAAERIKQLKVVIEKPSEPDHCYEPVPDGKSGNMKLATQCSYCEYKRHCWRDANDGQGLRVFRYSNGLRYLTDVQKEPKVEEIL